MFKIVFFTLLVIAGISAEANPEAKPDAKSGIVAPLAYTAPVAVDAPIVTATSSQIIARNYNGIAAPLVAAPVSYTAYSPYYVSPYTYTVNSVSPIKYKSIVSAPIKYTSAALVI